MYTAILLAAGSGSRAELGYNKVLYTLSQKPVFMWSLEQFLAQPECKQVLIVTQEAEIDTFTDLLEVFQVLDPRIEFVVGGSERQESVHNALHKTSQPYVLIHDAARPFINQEQLSTLYEHVQADEAVILAVPAKDTIKQVENGVIEQTHERQKMYLAQTPQAFATKLIMQAHHHAVTMEIQATDDASLIEQLCLRGVHVVAGSYVNMKVTTPEDFVIAEALIEGGMIQS
ncbi:MAG: 2-C-methyl-D-erythritol 4-phosphate cytidylyltransferase [Culicoidibacterales bacterium]